MTTLAALVTVTTSNSLNLDTVEGKVAGPEWSRTDGDPRPHAETSQNWNRPRVSQPPLQTHPRWPTPEPQEADSGAHTPWKVKETVTRSLQKRTPQVLMRLLNGHGPVLPPCPSNVLTAGPRAGHHPART